MKRLWVWVLVIAALALVGARVARWMRERAIPQTVASAPAATTAAARGELRVVEANIRIADPKDGINAWPNRREMLVAQLLKRDPDVIGMQEVSPAQAAYLIKEMPAYKHYPDGSGESDGVLTPVTSVVAALNMIMYRAERFEVVENSAGPVRGMDAGTDPRTAAFYSMVVLKDKSGALPETAVFDTHLRHSMRVATLDAMELNNRITAVRRSRPGVRVVLMGDMNWDRNSTVYGPLTGAESAFGPGTPVTKMRDTYDYAAKGDKERWGSWHNFTGTANALWPTDFIFVSSEWAVVRPAEIVRESVDGKWPSDHFLLWAVVK